MGLFKIKIISQLQFILFNLFSNKNHEKIKFYLFLSHIRSNYFLQFLNSRYKDSKQMNDNFQIKPPFDTTSPSSKTKKYIDVPHSFQKKRYDSKPSIQSPYFQVQLDPTLQKTSKPTNLITSLITKIKNVERHSDRSFSSKQISNNQASQATLYPITNKFGEQLRNKIKLPSQKNQFMNDGSNNLEERSSKRQIDQIYQQNVVLKSKVSQLVIENQRLKIRLNDTLVLQEKMLEKNKTQKQGEPIINQNQTYLLSFQQLDIANSQRHHKNRSLQISLSNIHVQNDRILSIEKTLDEVVFPIQNEALQKALKQIRELKLEKLELEKKCITALSQFRKNKEEQLEAMKKGFASNLNHYKQLLCKISMKPHGSDLKKHQQDTFQTVILESSSCEED